MNIMLKPELRPCYVIINRDGPAKALFHTWENWAAPYTAYLQGQTSGQISRLYGIVELEDGRVIHVDPDDIQFIDSEGLFNEIAWKGEKEC